MKQAAKSIERKIVGSYKAHRSTIEEAQEICWSNRISLSSYIEGLLLDLIKKQHSKNNKYK